LSAAGGFRLQVQLLHLQQASEFSVHPTASNQWFSWREKPSGEWKDNSSHKKRFAFCAPIDELDDPKSSIY